MPKYRWDSPYEWLEESARTWDAAKLYQELLNLALLLDSDGIQDAYQDEMSEDGYFDPLPEPGENEEEVTP